MFFCEKPRAAGLLTKKYQLILDRPLVGCQELIAR
jgi:hypothetical protein